MSMEIGIDLGTSFSLAAYLERGRPRVIPDMEGEKLTPSVVGILKNGGHLVGRPANVQAAANPDGTVFSIKRRMGRKNYLHPDGLIAGSTVVRHIKRKMGSDYRVMVNDREYSPEELSAMILKKLKKDAERYLGESVEKAVISVPAYFNISQRQATLDAGAIAGLDVIRIMDEPTAAALAYGLDTEEIETVLVWDLGGGTFDVSVLDFGGGVFEVKSVNGDTELGGDDFDERIMEWLASGCQREYGVDLRADKAAMIRTREAARDAKHGLTERDAVTVRLPFVKTMDGRPWNAFLTRKVFEEMTGDLLQKMIEPTERALKDAGITPGHIDRAILVGGSTRMPAVRALLRKIIGREPYVEIQPDEAVAMGAAIQAGILTGRIDKRVLIDVIPISMGIETEGGIYAKIVERNTVIPVSRDMLFTNASDDQTSMDIHVLQGERTMAGYNMTVDRFEMDGIPPCPRGSARIEVKFEINAGGVLNVFATDLHTDNSKAVRINPRFHGLPADEIKSMMDEAQGFRESD
ncbi:MAG: molecular chaperone DnaK, partial [Deltaproteobacteria bacterium]|nr:molecular chaperone DnaK [Deltaproteobacteria bacterium]